MYTVKSLSEMSLSEMSLSEMSLGENEVRPELR